MEKIRLDVNHLRVESFTPATHSPALGTVLGFEATPATGCLQCMGTQARMTCYATCPTGDAAG